MHDLAKAYEIPVTPDGTKEQILPVMMDAEQRGVFRQQPVHNYYLRKAAFTSDRPGENTEWGIPPKDRTPKPNAFRALQRRAKELGVAGPGMTTADYERAIKEAEEREQGGSDSETGSVSGHEGVPGQDGYMGETSEGRAVE